jgi:predicted ATPase
MPTLDSVNMEGGTPPALDSIEVEGYKSIRAARIDLGAINLLIGANGAGKSNLIGVFDLLADLADHRLQLHVARQGGADAILHFGRKKTPSLRISMRLGHHDYEAMLAPGASDTLVFEHEIAPPKVPPFSVPEQARRLPMGEHMGVPGHKETGLNSVKRVFGTGSFASEPIITAIKNWRPFHFHDPGGSSPTKQKQKIDDNRTLRAEGGNLAPFLHALRAVAPGAYRRIVEAVRSIAPFFDDFMLEPDVTNPGVIQLAWRHASDDGMFTADSLSDGTLRFICLATLLLQPTLPSLIVVDEPELGLHPFAISQLAALVRAAATRTQLILATQSVTLLDQFDVSEVIVAEQTKGESSFRHLHETPLTDWKQDYSLGELWLKNVLGGRPR